MAFCVEVRSPSTNERWVMCHHAPVSPGDDYGHHGLSVNYDATEGDLLQEGWRYRNGRLVCPEHATDQDSVSR